MNFAKTFSVKKLLQQVQSKVIPVKLIDERYKKFILDRYTNKKFSELDYATVKDFCDSADYLPQICYLNGDLKNVQRPWALKAVLGSVPLNGKILEIGGGLPLVAGMLAELEYKTVVVDPYEGAGNGPTEYKTYTQQFPHVKLVKSSFDFNLCENDEFRNFDCIYSISVLEHISKEDIKEVFDGIRKCLKPGGLSIHCIDVVIQGDGTQAHEDNLREIFYQQTRLQYPNCLRSDTDKQCNDIITELKSDLETFYLSPTGHHLWRCGKTYDEFPFRKVVSVQTCVNYITSEH